MSKKKCSYVLGSLRTLGLVSVLGLSAQVPRNPVLDANWDWTVNVPQSLYYSLNGVGPTRVTADLPYFTPGNRITAKDYPDIYPVDGWQLVHKDFGTPDAAPAFPLFTLYNKYRGIFRVMLYNAVNQENSFLLGELSFLDGHVKPENSAALFSFNRGLIFGRMDDQKTKQVTTSEMAKFGNWAVFDFPMLGYDPELESRDPVIQFKLQGVSRSRITLNGRGGLELSQIISSQDGYASGFHQGVAKIVMGASNSYMHYRSVANWYDELSNPRHADKAWVKGLAALANGRMSMVPWVLAAGPLVSTFFGGADRASEWEPLRFAGLMTLQIDGTIEQNQVLWYYNLHVNPGPEDARACRPVQKIHWGILSFPEIPDARTHIDYLPNWQIVPTNVRLRRNPGITINPNIGMEIESIEMAWLKSENHLLDGTPITLANAGSITDENPIAVAYFSRFMSLDEAMATDVPVGPSFFDLPSGMQWRIRLKAKEPTWQMDRNLLLITTTKSTLFQP
jgi:hypothetical protein